MKCNLCNIEWNETDESNFFQSHMLSEIHLLNSKYHNERIQSRKQRHERMREKQ